MGASKGKSDLIRAYIDKFPKVSTHQLTRMLCAEHPVMFPDFESARGIVRYVRGSHGEALRDRIVAAGHNKYTWESIGRAIPDPVKPDYKPFYLPEVKARYLLGADVHFPFHDELALEVAMEYGYKQGCKRILLAGDLADNYSESHFLKDPSKIQLKEEIAQVREYIRALSQLYEQVYYLEGNHELRWRDMILTRGPELLGLNEFRFENLVCSETISYEEGDAKPKHYPNVQYIGGKREVRIGALNIIHGHEYGRGLTSPVNPARGMFLKTTECTVSAHLHRTSEHVEKTLRDRYVSCWSLGCLCYLHPEYARMNKWNHGFGILETDGRDFVFTNKKIIKGKVV
jgi:hypothetical protein